MQRVVVAGPLFVPASVATEQARISDVIDRDDSRPERRPVVGARLIPRSTT